MSSRFGNKKKSGFINSLPELAIEDTNSSKRMKFNFSFFDGSQDPGCNFSDLNKGDVIKIIEKLKSFSADDLTYWRNQRCGKSGLKVFAEYGDFPRNTDFKHPKHVPHDVMWARFRMESAFRLVGFLVPNEFHEKFDKKNGYLFDRNTFYVVFLDKDHRFYKTEKK